MEPCKIRRTTKPRTHAPGLEGKEISSPSSRGRKMSLTSPLIDLAIRGCNDSWIVKGAWPTLQIVNERVRILRRHKQIESQCYRECSLVSGDRQRLRRACCGFTFAGR